MTTWQRIYQPTMPRRVRGATPRYWEDVASRRGAADHGQGTDDRDRLHCLRPGLGRPLYPREQAGLAAGQRTIRGLGIPNRFGIPDCPERVHWEPEFALMVGAPGAYDYGPERCSWLTHQLTNWMGDDGFLRPCELQNPPAQSRRRPAVHRRQGRAQVRRGWSPSGRDRTGGAQSGRRVIGGRFGRRAIDDTPRPAINRPWRSIVTSLARTCRRSAASACRSPSSDAPAASRAPRCASGRRAR